MKKLFFLFVSFLATTCLWAYDFQSGDLSYNITSSSAPYTVEVTYEEWESSYNYAGLTTATIPETVTYNGTTYSVTRIGYRAFYYCSALESITIPNSVTSIGISAFEYTGIYNDESNWEDGVLYISNCLIEANEDITGAYTIKDGTRLIADDAFQYCSSLTSITIPKSVTSIGGYAFYGCTSITTPVYNAHCFAYMPTSYKGAYIIPDGIKQIADGAFYDCSSLTSITIPNSVTSIGGGAFSSCSSLTSITIPNSVTSIGGGAFSYCSSLSSITIPNSVTSIGEMAFFGCSSLSSITIPNSVTSIGISAFEDCSSLTSVTIPNSVTSIGYEAFSGCSALESVTIPNSVTSIGGSAFYNTGIYNDESNWENGVLYISNCLIDAKTNITGAYTIKDGTRLIAGGAFSSCSSLTSITIPNSVTSIGDNAFENCSSLTRTNYTGDIAGWCNIKFGNYSANPMYYSHNFYINDQEIKDLVIPNSVTSIGDYAFSGCSSLTSVTIPNSVTSIGDYAFSGCSSLSSITIPNSVTSIGDKAFYDCSSLSVIICKAETPASLGSSVFDGVSKSIPVYVPCSCIDSYRSSDWSCFYNIQEPLAEYSIDISTQNSQMGTTQVDKNTICGNSISATANYGYHFVQWSDGNTDNPRSLELTQDTVLTAEFAQTFSGQCGDNLYWSYQNSTLTISGFGEMYNNRPWGLFINEIQSVVLPNGINHIGDDAFNDCTGLSEITIPYTVISIGDYAFAGCRKLVHVNCYAINPPMAETTSFANYNVYLNVPCDNLQDYQLDMVFGSFKYIQCMEADSENVPTDDVVVTPGTNDVTITWPTAENADTYTIVIQKGNEVFCTLTFNAEGQLLNIAFAPGRDGNRPAQYAEQTVNGYRFTVTGLKEGTDYTYDITVKDASNKTIKSHSGEFTTQSTTAVNNITTNNANIKKIMRNGQLIIIRNGVEYNAVGQEI